MPRNRRRTSAGGEPRSAAIADIHAAIVDLRRYTPVVGIIAGTVGRFGGMLDRRRA